MNFLFFILLKYQYLKLRTDINGVNCHRIPTKKGKN